MVAGDEIAVLAGVLAVSLAVRTSGAVIGVERAGGADDIMRDGKHKAGFLKIGSG